MRRFIFTFTCFVALLIPVGVLASGGDNGFDGVVRGLEAKYHVRATRIPFLGLVSAVSGHEGRPGVANMHVATFEDFSAQVDGEDITRMVDEKLGPQWSRMVRETSNHGHDQTLVYVHPEGKRMGMFVLDADGSELDVVQLSVDPQHLSEQLGQYEHHDRRSGDASD